ncbi:acetamidase/formamidase [Nitzschia inconspicua]|uniref:Acetamidase/formamidase n=1 Tax=Nitzschia inconspicua TaxID=303405 RepID=A0A9K3KYQ0_9STRA|nr:acetamidase/formamidase [Nitzschia inconspicua]
MSQFPGRSSFQCSPVFPEAKYFVSKDHCQSEFSSSIRPILTVEPDSLVHVETNDCFHGKVQPNNNDITVNGVSAFDWLSAIPLKDRNPVTGPIFIQGAEKGDVLAVTLVDIRPQGVGVACCGSDSGQLCHWMRQYKRENKDPCTTDADASVAAIRFFDLTEETTCQEVGNGRDTTRIMVTMRETYHTDGVANNNGNKNDESVKRIGPIAFPASPMLGVIGVAPAEEEDDSIGTMPAGKHGGNLDNRANGIGSTIYLPVNHAGALLSIGDMHASQGDGEISGTGVEIGGHVLLTCHAWKRNELYPNKSKDNGNSLSIPLQLEYPVTETATHWITYGVVIENIPQTTQIACQEAAKILMGQWGFSLEEAFIFLSVQGDLGLCQACHPDTGTQIAKMSVPKLKSVCPRPFRAVWEKIPMEMLT